MYELAKMSAQIRSTTSISPILVELAIPPHEQPAVLLALAHQARQANLVFLPSHSVAVREAEGEPTSPPSLHRRKYGRHREPDETLRDSQGERCQVSTRKGGAPRPHHSRVLREMGRMMSLAIPGSVCTGQL